MTTSTQTHMAYVEAHPNYQQLLAGEKHPWLKQQQQSAIESFALSGFPNTKMENWKYTHLKPLTQHVFHPAKKAITTLPQETLAQYGFDNWSGLSVAFVDGHYVDQWGDTDLPPGVTICNLKTALDKHPELIKKHFMSDKQATHFSALNLAYISDGIFIHVAKNVIIEQAIQLIYISTQEQQGKQSSHLRNVIIAEESSQFSIAETYIGDKEACYLTNVENHHSIAAQANLSYYTLQDESKTAFHVQKNTIQQQQDSLYKHYHIDFGGRLVRRDIQCQLQAKGSRCELYGLYMLNGKQHVDNHTLITHEVPHTESFEYFKGSLDEQSRGVFNGKILVKDGATQTDSVLENHNLLLSDKAEIDTKPELEIYNDDVKCSHGTTVGNLDQDAIFYLKSRGIDEKSARDMLIDGFAHDVIDRIVLDTIRMKLDHMINTRMANNSMA